MKPNGDRRSRKKRTVYGQANRERRNSAAFSSTSIGLLDAERETPRSNPETKFRSPTELSADRWPQLRIVRPVDVDMSGEDNGWQNFFRSLARQNQTKGRLLLGTLACEFVNGDSMTAMFSERYGRAFESRRRALQFQRQFADEFGQFVRSSERERSDARFASQISGHDQLTDDSVDEMRWNYGLFAIRGMDIAGPDTVGLDLTDNEQLYAEWNDVREYLRQEGLNINHLRHPGTERLEFTPNIPFFETFDGAGRVALRYTVDRPLHIPLESPFAEVTPGIA